MLTQEQKDLLEPLTRHEKYGELLIHAMKAWEIAEPKRATYGVSRYNNTEQSNSEVISDYNKCCLVGASIVGKSKSNEYLEEAAISFQIDIIETLSLAHGFDASGVRFNDDVNAYQCGNKVSSIIFDS